MGLLSKVGRGVQGPAVYAASGFRVGLGQEEDVRFGVVGGVVLGVEGGAIEEVAGVAWGVGARPATGDFLLEVVAWVAVGVSALLVGMECKSAGTIVVIVVVVMSLAAWVASAGAAVAAMGLQGEVVLSVVGLRLSLSW